MTQPSPLESYLTPQRMEGEYESEGQFTLNVEKARLKAAKYRSVSRGGAALKII